MDLVHPAYSKTYLHTYMLWIGQLFFFFNICPCLENSVTNQCKRDKWNMDGILFMVLTIVEIYIQKISNISHLWIIDQAWCHHVSVCLFTLCVAVSSQRVFFLPLSVHPSVCTNKITLNIVKILCWLHFWTFTAKTAMVADEDRRCRQLDTIKVFSRKQFQGNLCRGIFRATSTLIE